MSVDGAPGASGRCLCGRVRYEVHGPLREVLLCHCVECRRWHGHVGAYTAVSSADLVLVEAAALQWFQSPCSDAGARRGFCRLCGSSLFWQARDGGTVSIAAGTLDGATGLHAGGHWYVSQAGAYYELPDDGLPRWSRSGGQA